MDAPVWSNDILYLKEMILTFAVTIAITIACFRMSKSDDRRHAHDTKRAEARARHRTSVTRTNSTPQA